MESVSIMLKRFSRILLLMILLEALLGDVTFAQEDVVWLEPVRLSDSNSEPAGPPAMTTDAAGNVHVIWDQKPLDNGDISIRNVLFYTKWDGEGWSTPIDVLVSPDNANAVFPELVATDDDMLHAVWSTGGQTGAILYYSSAPACCANEYANWSQPKALSGSAFDSFAFVTDSRGYLHLAYSTIDGKRIIYLISIDGGISWENEIIIPGGTFADDEFAVYPRLSVDDTGRVHAAWTILPWPGRRIMYTRSDASGTVWEEPRIIDSVDSGEYRPEYGPIYVDVETFGQDEVHLSWDGAPTIERTHVWSQNGGQSWSWEEKLFPEVSSVGRAGFNDMVVDAEGTTHIVSIQGSGSPLYAQRLQSVWSPSIVLDQSSLHPHHMRIALSNGNRIHIIWEEKGDASPFSIRYVQGTTSAREIETRPLAVLAPPVESEPVTPPAPTPTLLPKPTAMPDWSRSQVPSKSDPTVAFLFAIPAVLVFVGLVVLIAYRSRVSLR